MGVWRQAKKVNKNIESILMELRMDCTGTDCWATATKQSKHAAISPVVEISEGQVKGQQEGAATTE
jgi:hypothetical protein